MASSALEIISETSATGLPELESRVVAAQPDNDDEDVTGFESDEDQAPRITAEELEKRMARAKQAEAKWRREMEEDPEEELPGSWAEEVAVAGPSQPAKAVTPKSSSAIVHIPTAPIGYSAAAAGTVIESLLKQVQSLEQRMIAQEAVSKKQADTIAAQSLEIKILQGEFKQLSDSNAKICMIASQQQVELDGRLRSLSSEFLDIVSDAARIVTVTSGQEAVAMEEKLDKARAELLDLQSKAVTSKQQVSAQVAQTTPSSSKPHRKFRGIR